MDKHRITGYEVIEAEEDNENYYYTVQVQPIIPPVTCPHCESNEIIKAGTRKFVVLDVPRLRRGVKLNIKRRRYLCKSCKSTILESLPFVNQKHRMSLQLMGYIEQRIFIQSATTIARDVHTTEATIRNIIQEILNEADQDKIAFEKPHIIGIHDLRLHNGTYKIITNVEAQTITNILPKTTNSKRIRLLREYFDNLVQNNKVTVILDTLAPSVLSIMEEYQANLNIILNMNKIIKAEAYYTKKVFFKLIVRNKDLLKGPAKLGLTEEERRVIRFFDFIIDNELPLSGDIQEQFIQYNKKYPVLKKVYDIHETFLNIWKSGAGHDEYIEWNHKIADIKSLYDNFDNLMKLIMPIATQSDNDHLISNYTKHFDLIDQLNQSANVLKHGYVLRKLWHVLINPKDTVETSHNIEYVENIKKHYEHELEAWKGEGIQKYGIDINSLIHALRHTPT